MSGGTVRRFIGVYDADGSLARELADWVGRRLGRTHCALCDNTHGGVRERSDWKRCRTGLPVPVEPYHRDDQPAEARTVTVGRLPAVVAVTDGGPRLLLGPDELERCAGSPVALIDAITTACDRHYLSWPDPTG